MALTDDTQLNTLFATFLTALSDASAADVALQGAVANLPTLRTDSVAKNALARTAYNDFLRRIGTTSMTAPQRAAFKRVFGDLDDLNPGQLGGAVKRALEGG